jgi:hypothetical protein
MLVDVNESVMAGLVPAIHVFARMQGRTDVDARDKRGHDEFAYRPRSARTAGQ